MNPSGAQLIDEALGELSGARLVKPDGASSGAQMGPAQWSRLELGGARREQLQSPKGAALRS
eukprot:11839529-Alexandrium_andersonii.AAC.1